MPHDMLGYSYAYMCYIHPFDLHLTVAVS
jgi:hypothetical protein